MVKINLKKSLVLIALLASASQVATADTRKASTVREFHKLNACPATGKVQSTCPGYVIDHIIPLCAGGPDEVANMMWQTREASYKKDVMERSVCKRLAQCTSKSPSK